MGQRFSRCGGVALLCRLDGLGLFEASRERQKLKRQVMGPTCIHCRHCDIAEVDGEDFLICDLHGEDRLKVVAMGDTCFDWFPGLLVGYSEGNPNYDLFI